MKWLADAYEQGVGVPEDHAQAFMWWSMAAQHGDAWAQKEVGLALANGDGVPEDDASARIHLQQATARLPRATPSIEEAATLERLRTGAPAPPTATTAPPAIDQAIATYAAVFAQGPHPAPEVAPAPIDPDLRAFADGSISTTCELACAGGWGFHLDRAEELYQGRQWEALARLVIGNNYAEDLPYFYLAAAAHGLGYDKAAEAYVDIAYAFTTGRGGCARAINLCKGHVFPDEEIELLDAIRAAQRSEAAAALTDDQRAAITAYIRCVARGAGDAFAADGQGMIAAVSACASQDAALRQSLEAGWTDDQRQAFDAAFSRQALQASLDVVEAARRGATF